MVIAIQRDNDVSGGVGESFFVGPSVTPMKFGRDDRTHPASNFGSPVGGIVVDNNGFIDKLRKSFQYFLDALLLIQARDDNRDSYGPCTCG